LYTALGKLGYKSYHMLEIAISEESKKNSHMFCWDEGLRAKLYGEGKPYGREEFDKVLGSYSAVADIPSACFPDEFIAAYPNAKVVLGVRDPDKWVASVETSFYTILGWPLWTVFSWMHKGFGAERRTLKMALSLWTNGDIYNRQKLREGFLKHNQHVREIVPKDNLLEWEAKDGWGPLCQFLGKEIPDEPFPRVNEGSNIANVHAKFFYILFPIELAKWSVIPVSVFAIGMGVKWYREGGRLTVPFTKLY